jgi:hypothetical protein
MGDKRIALLKTLDRLAKGLARARGLKQVKAIRDEVESLRSRARADRLGIENENAAAESKLRAERRAGQMLIALFHHGGDRRSKPGHNNRSSLADLGITPDQSARWRHEAIVSDDKFEKYLANAKRRGDRISSEDLLRLAQLLDSVE